jgi:hypothetical protein
MTRPRKPTLQGKFSRKLDSVAPLQVPDAAAQAAAIAAEFTMREQEPPLPPHRPAAGDERAGAVPAGLVQTSPNLTTAGASPHADLSPSSMDSEANGSGFDQLSPSRHLTAPLVASPVASDAPAPTSSVVANGVATPDYLPIQSLPLGRGRKSSAAVADGRIYPNEIGGEGSQPHEDDFAALKERILGHRRTRGSSEMQPVSRTSLRLDAEIFRRLKRLALDEQTTQEKLIETALIRLFEEKASK